MTFTLVIMQGIAGSGKSTIAQRIANVSPFEGDATIRSTDDFWGTPEDYAFDVKRLGVAHRWNQDRVKQDMIDGVETIVVDNTNITRQDTRPYFEMADRYNYIVQVVRVSVPIDVALARNALRPSNRRVPESVILSQYKKIEDLLHG